MAELVDVPQSPQGLSRERRYGITACMWFALLAGLYAMSHVFTPDTWVVQVGLFVGLVAVVTNVVRNVTNNDVLATLSGLGFSTLGLVTVFGSATASWSLPLLPGSWTSLIDHFRTAGEYLNDTAPAVPITPETLLLLTTVAACLYVVMDALAIGLGLPLLAVAVATVGWVPALALEMQAPLWPIVVVLLAGLTAAQLRVWSPYTSGLWGRRAVLTVSAVVAALVIGPALPHVDLTRFGGNSGSGSGGGGGVTTELRLTDDLDLRAHLQERSQDPMLTYHAESNYPVERIRLTTSDTFDGRRWSAGPGRQGRVSELTGDDYLWQPDGYIPDIEPLEVSATIEELRTLHLPIPAGPTSVTADGMWHIDLDSGVLTSNFGDLEPDTEYTFSYYRNALAYEELNDVSAPTSAGVEFLTLPDDPYVDLIRDYAENVTADATTQLEQAVALQSHFRSSPNFSYSFEVGEPVTSNAVYDFLSDGQGYCVQFASAMATLARSLDIPSRVGIGFLPGSRQGDGSFVILGEDAHAWPELYFEGIGWVPFEPTPSIQTGSAPSWTVPEQTPSTPTPTPTESATLEPSPTPELTTATPTQTAATGAGGTSLLPLALLWFLGVALLGLLTWATFAVVQRYRVGPIKAASAERVYELLRSRMGRIGISWPDHTPVSKVPDVVIEQLLTNVFNRTKALRELDEAIQDLRTWATLSQEHWYAEEQVDVADVATAANRGWLAIYDWQRN